MPETVGCFHFLRGRRSLKKYEVTAPLEVQQPQRHHGGGEVVSDFPVLRVILNRFCSQQILAFRVAVALGSSANVNHPHGWIHRLLTPNMTHPRSPIRV